MPFRTEANHGPNDIVNANKNSNYAMYMRNSFPAIYL